jgi:hypothetical protein
MADEGYGPAVLRLGSAKFADWLTRPADREIFGLPPLPDPTRPAAGLAAFDSD